MRVSMCHCLACQRRTGSAFGLQARFADAQVVEARGTGTTYARTADSGGVVTSTFCPICGSTIALRLDRLPGFVVVPVGAFADPSFAAPSVSVYEARRHAFCRFAELEAERID